MYGLSFGLRHRVAAVCVMAVLVTLVAMTSAQARPLRLAGSIYVGWMPWFLAAHDGTLAKYAKDNGLEIGFVPGDYLETVTLFAGGQVDAVVVTNIDALGLIVSAGVKSNAVLVGSFSHGNDAILLRKPSDGLMGKTLGLVELSVSQYLLDRYLQTVGLPSTAVKLRNIADSEMAAAYAGGGLDGVVTWNPIALELRRQGATAMVDSSAFPREIADLLVVRREVLEAEPRFAAALLATWFDVTGRMAGPKASETTRRLAALSASTPEDYDRQLRSTVLIATPDEALAAITDASNAERVRLSEEFAVRHGLMDKAPPRPWVGAGSEADGVLRYDPAPLLRFAARAQDGGK